MAVKGKIIEMAENCFSGRLAWLIMGGWNGSMLKLLR
jgi:hypothetical protein